MRVKIHFVLTSRPKAQKPTNNLEVGDPQPTPLAKLITMPLTLNCI